MNQQNVRSGMLKDEELQNLFKESERVKDLPMFIEDSSILSQWSSELKLED